MTKPSVCQWCGNRLRSPHEPSEVSPLDVLLSRMEIALNRRSEEQAQAIVAEFFRDLRRQRVIGDRVALAEIELEPRVHELLDDAGVVWLDDLHAMTPEPVRSLPNIGPHGVRLVAEALRDHGLLTEPWSSYLASLESTGPFLGSSCIPPGKTAFHRVAFPPARRRKAMKRTDSSAIARLRELIGRLRERNERLSDGQLAQRIGVSRSLAQRVRASMGVEGRGRGRPR